MNTSTCIKSSNIQVSHGVEENTLLAKLTSKTK